MQVWKMNINLELEKVIKQIKTTNPNSILIQLPDGLKPKAEEIITKLKPHTNAKIYINLGTCFGACDIPKLENIDLLIQWGHSEYY
jgi:diphthamide biosynthesis enzyme Dph1/Dph2-like protein